MTHLRAGLEEAKKIVEQCLSYSDPRLEADEIYALRRACELIDARLAALPEVEPPTVTREMVDTALDKYFDTNWRRNPPGYTDLWRERMRATLTAALSVQAKGEGENLSILDGIDRALIAIKALRQSYENKRHGGMLHQREIDALLNAEERVIALRSIPSPPKGGETP